MQVAGEASRGLALAARHGSRVRPRRLLEPDRLDGLRPGIARIGPGSGLGSLGFGGEPAAGRADDRAADSISAPSSMLPRATPRKAGRAVLRGRAALSLFGVGEAGDADVGLRLPRGRPVRREPLRRRALPRVLPRRRRRALCAVPDRALLLRPDRRHRPRPDQRLRGAAGDARHHRALSRQRLRQVGAAQVRARARPSRRQGDGDRALLPLAAASTPPRSTASAWWSRTTRPRPRRRRRSTAWSRPTSRSASTNEAQTAAAILGYNFQGSTWYQEAMRS